MVSHRNAGVFKGILLAPNRTVRVIMTYGDGCRDVTNFTEDKTWGEDDNGSTITVAGKYRDIGNGLVSVWKARRDAIEHRLGYLLPIVEDPSRVYLCARELHCELLVAIRQTQLGTSFPREPPMRSFRFSR